MKYKKTQITMYKIIAFGVANELQKILDKLIGSEQKAYTCNKGPLNKNKCKISLRHINSV